MSRKGFSLVEMLVVMAILGVMTALALVNFRQAEYGDELRLAAQNLAAELRRAQTFALIGRTVQHCRSDDLNNAENGKFCPSGNNLECGNKGFCIQDAPLGGFGVRIDTNDGGRTALFFADTGNASGTVNPDHLYQEGELLRQLNFAFGQNVSVTAVTPADNGRLDVAFLAPRPKAFFNGDDSWPTATIVLSHAKTGNAATVTVNGISGQISIE